MKNLRKGLSGLLIFTLFFSIAFGNMIITASAADESGIVTIDYDETVKYTFDGSVNSSYNDEITLPDIDNGETGLSVYNSKDGHIQMEFEGGIGHGMIDGEEHGLRFYNEDSTNRGKIKFKVAGPCQISIGLCEYNVNSATNTISLGFEYENGGGYPIFSYTKTHGESCDSVYTVRYNYKNAATFTLDVANTTYIHSLAIAVDEETVTSIIPMEKRDEPYNFEFRNYNGSCNLDMGMSGTRYFNKYLKFSTSGSGMTSRSVNSGIMLKSYAGGIATLTFEFIVPGDATITLDRNGYNVLGTISATATPTGDGKGTITPESVNSQSKPREETGEYIADTTEFNYVGDEATINIIFTIPRESASLGYIYIHNLIVDTNPDIKEDVDKDGDFDATDAALLLKYISGLASEDDINYEYADYNKDGNIDILDVIYILNMYAPEKSDETETVYQQIS